ncbi:glycosyltransferase family 4 protein [Butyrivibrio proteoclasticus]|nr:glycosyltransferase family 4 protein [Butyrivibrio proteoclasticus]
MEKGSSSYTDNMRYEMSEERYLNLTVLYFLDYGQEYGGAVHTLVHQALLAKRHGVKLFFFLSSHSGKNISSQFTDLFYKYNLEFEVFDFSISSQPEDIDIICIDENYDVIKKRISEIKPDLIHSVQLNIIAELAGRELGIPHIMNIYPLTNDFFATEYVDVFPHYMICDSYYWGEQWKEHIGVQYTCIRTVVEKISKKKKPFNPGNMKCVIVGSIYSLKNQLEVIKGFAEAINRGVVGTLDVYGDDGNTYATICKEFVKEYGYSDYIRFNGFCNEMEKVYDDADVLICGSVRESYPNVISEAMSHGLIIISTSVGGIPEIIDDENNGYLTTGFSCECFSEILLKVKKTIEEGKAEDISRNAVYTAEENHSWKRIQKKLLDYYYFVLTDRVKDVKKHRYSIYDLRKDFFEIITVYKENKYRFTEPRVASSKVWYIAYYRQRINRAISEGKRFYVWGAGRYGKTTIELINVFFPTLIITGIIDTFVNGTFCGFEIFRPDSCFHDDECIVFIGLANGQWDVVDKLKKSGKVYGADFFVLAPREW